MMERKNIVKFVRVTIDPLFDSFFLISLAITSTSP